MTEHNDPYWLFNISVSDCAGALTSVAAAFSNEGISIDMIKGRKMEAGKSGLIMLGFISSKQGKDVLVRKIKRLTKVIDIEERQSSSKEVSEMIAE